MGKFQHYTSCVTLKYRKQPAQKIDINHINKTLQQSQTNMIITVDGQIGSGKSTILEYLSQNLDASKYVIVQEDVSDWTALKDSNNRSIFELFYSDMKKYSYVFQSFVLFSRMQLLLDAKQKYPQKTIICERSFMTDLEIFAKSLYEQNNFSDIEWAVYVKWHKLAQSIIDVKLDGIIYIRSSPEVCIRRIQQRARESEDAIDASYIHLIHKKHEEWLMDPARNTLPMMVIDGNRSKADLQTTETLTDIENFIQGIEGHDAQRDFA
jgi:deoxyadenosine/deoxycytidine kinase